MISNPFRYLLALAGAAACAGPAVAGGTDFKSDYLPLEKNLAFELDAPGAVSAQVSIAGEDLGEGLRFELGLDDHDNISGGVYAPPGDGRLVSVVIFNADGKPIYRGESVVDVDEELTPEFAVPLGEKDSRHPLEARLGSRLLSAGIVGGDEELIKVQVALTDPYGRKIPFSPEDLYWELPDGFPEIKYSCFGGEACILEWKPTRQQEVIYLCMKLKPQPCVTIDPDDYRGPYKYVAVGRQHTCAITRDDDVRCWGDNGLGQLGTATSGTCIFNSCSLVPVPVTCPPGEICKFRALAAGGDHTCAVDRNGKAWCWGEDGVATGESSFGSLPNFTHRQIPAFSKGGNADFVAIDTSMGHTCALTSAQEVFCWGDNSTGQIGRPLSEFTFTTKATLISSGNLYKSVTTGALHSCAIQANGLLDCWGDNSRFQLTGNTNTAKFITVNSKIPLLNGKTVRRVAAGTSSTCAENSDNNAICWGKPSFNAPSSSANPGFIALAGSSSTSLATEMDDCAGGFQNCTQTCLTDSWGELLCRNWVLNVTPGALAPMDKPWPDYGVDYTQVDVGPNHACAVTDERDIWCWGLNDFGQFGTGTFSATDTLQPKTRTNR
jgi:alpha-tubulin suppressor-like RCC1 family protein